MQVIRSMETGNDWYDYYLIDGNKRLGIMFLGNGDLYFCSFNRCQESEFLITKENMSIYSLFDYLFHSFENANVHKVTQGDLLRCCCDQEKISIYNQINQLNQKLKREEVYKKLYSNQKIVWISDDSFSFDKVSADAMTIIKESNSYKIKFTYYEDKYPHLRSIRIRNARSRYKPFNLLMMDFFNNLQNYNPDFHQIHIEEYLFNKNKGKILVNKKI